LRESGFDGEVVLVGADVNEHVQALIRSGREVDAAALCDPHSRLDSLAAPADDGVPAT
jgi:ABC-type sugar transport system substrate-binding protein